MVELSGGLLLGLTEDGDGLVQSEDAPVPGLLTFDDILLPLPVREDAPVIPCLLFSVGHFDGVVPMAAEGLWIPVPGRWAPPSIFDHPLFWRCSQPWSFLRKTLPSLSANTLFWFDPLAGRSMAGLVSAESPGLVSARAGKVLGLFSALAGRVSGLLAILFGRL